MALWCLRRELFPFWDGERTGNTPLEAMVFEYAQLRGSLDGMDTTVITELAEYYEKEIGYHIPEHTIFVINLKIRDTLNSHTTSLSLMKFCVKYDGNVDELQKKLMDNGILGRI